LGIDRGFTEPGPNEPPTNPQPTPSESPLNYERFQEKNRGILVDGLMG